MNIKISTNISNEFEDITINIQAPKMTEELQKIITNLSSISSIKEEVVATKNNEIFLLNTKEILYFYSDEKYNYAKTQNETYRIKEKLYESINVFRLYYFCFDIIMNKKFLNYLKLFKNLH